MPFTCISLAGGFFWLSFVLKWNVDGCSSPPPVAFQLSSAQVATQTAIPVSGGCGHSKYWNAGESTLSTGVVGGAPALPNEFPYQIRLNSNNEFICGGSIISATYVMTAGHCCDGESTSTLTVTVGDYNQSVVETGEVTYKVSSVTKHPSFDSSSLQYDFCLLKLSTTLTWSSYVQPICLASSCSQECSASNGDNVVITGWGLTSESATTTPKIMRKAVVPVVTTSSCSSAYSSSYTINSNNFCAGYLSTGGVDTCQGDSGGPLACFKNGYAQLDGVTSFGYGCARKGYPGVYARVCSVVSWIQSTATG